MFTSRSGEVSDPVDLLLQQRAEHSGNEMTVVHMSAKIVPLPERGAGGVGEGGGKGGGELNFYFRRASPDDRWTESCPAEPCLNMDCEPSSPAGSQST